MITNLLGLTTFVVILAGGQVLFKKVGLSIRGLPAADAIFAALGSRVLYEALGLYAVATVLWIWILSRVPLSNAYPWVGAGSAIVPLLGWYLFGEQIGPVFWLGVALVIAGIFLVQVGSHAT